MTGSELLFDALRPGKLVGSLLIPATRGATAGKSWKSEWLSNPAEAGGENTLFTLLELGDLGTGPRAPAGSGGSPLKLSGDARDERGDPRGEGRGDTRGDTGGPAADSVVGEGARMLPEPGAGGGASSGSLGVRSACRGDKLRETLNGFCTLTHMHIFAQQQTTNNQQQQQTTDNQQ